MRLFYFGKVTSEISQIILRQVESICGDNLEIFQTVDGLTKRLRHIEANPEIFVLAPANTEELTELVDRKDFFNDLPIILILPQHDQATIHSGHLLMPRFLTFSDSNHAEVKDVLEKMVNLNINKTIHA